VWEAACLQSVLVGIHLYAGWWEAVVVPYLLPYPTVWEWEVVITIHITFLLR